MADVVSEIKEAIVSIKVIGVGGGGNNVLLRMADDKAAGVELIAVNTDARQLAGLQKAGVTPLQIGERFTKGRGTGGQTDIGESAAVDDEARIAEAMRGADLVFITATMGGGAGTGAAPVVAKIAKKMGILSVGVVTMPFEFEGTRKTKIANEGIYKMQSEMDALIAIKNDNLLKLPENRRMTMIQAFKAADDILRQAIMCISEMILTTGLVNVDFADVTAIFRQSESSDALLAIGVSERGHVIEAIKNAVASPLIEKSLKGSRGIILNITGGESLSLLEVSEATQYIYDNTHDEVNIIFGVVIDKKMGEAVRATIVATDFTDSVIIKTPQLGQVKKQLDDFSLKIPDFMSTEASGIPQFRLSTRKEDRDE